MAPCREHIYVFRNPPLCAGTRCVSGATAAGPGMARPLHGPVEPFWCSDMSGLVPAEHINVFPTGPLPLPECIRQTGPVWCLQIRGRPVRCTAPRRGRGHARPVPHLQIWGFPDWCMAPCREHIYVFRNPPLCAGTWCVLQAGSAGPGMARPLQWPGGSILVPRYERASTGGTHKCVPYRAFATAGVHPTVQTRLSAAADSTSHEP